MKIAAYCALHYGAQYLEWAIRSVIDFVDSYHIFYTPHPSHGTQTRKSLPAGEDRDTLRTIAAMYGNDVIWHDVDKFYQEGDHRDYCIEYLAHEGCDLIIWNDADEVWDPDVLSDAMDFAITGSARDYRTHAMHFWRGVNWVCYDEAMPVRLIKPSGDGVAYVPGRGFYHFGYAQSEMLLQYKMTIHGHRAEIRRNWFPIYRDWKGPEDTPRCGVHPTCECDDKTGKAFWTPVPFNRFDIDHLIGDHPYFCDEII
jgi:hypothetical protein